MSLYSRDLKLRSEPVQLYQTTQARWQCMKLQCAILARCLPLPGDHGGNGRRIAMFETRHVELELPSLHGGDAGSQGNAGIILTELAYWFVHRIPFIAAINFN